MPTSRHTLRLATLALALAACAVPVAQAATPASGAAAIDADKQKLIDRVIAAWHPENGIIAAAQRPAVQSVEQARMIMQQQHLPQDKMEKTLKDMSPDIQKYVETIVPLVKTSVQKNASAALSPIFAQEFSNDELKQLAGVLESPVLAKFYKLNPQLDAALGKRIENEVGPEVNKSLTALNQALSAKLRTAVGAGGGASGSGN
jgi:hypothetical protein